MQKHSGQKVSPGSTNTNGNHVDLQSQQWWDAGNIKSTEKSVDMCLKHLPGKALLGNQM